MAIESSPPATPLDPALLVAFRREAGAILAQERGLTAAGRLKLAGVARQLGIAEEQIEAAIRSLGEAATPPAPDDPNLERFRQRLKKDLAGKSRSIIGPTIEAQIVAAAARKYGLDETAARRVLGDVAAELGLRRISADQAIDSLAEQIDQAAAESTWLAKEVWDRLRIAGAKWGIELEIVDQLIDEKLAANRADRQQRTFVVRATLFATAGAFGLVAIVLGLLTMHRTPEPALEEPPPSVAVAPALSPPGTSSSPGQPAWWDVDLTIAAASGRAKFKELEPAHPLLVSGSPAQRAAGYRAVAEIAARPRAARGMPAALGDLLAGCYALEPDDAAAGELLSAIVEQIPTSESPLPAGEAPYDAAYWAGETLVKLWHRTGLTEFRRRGLEAAAQRGLGLTINPAASRDEHERATRNALTRRLFANLTAGAAKQPAEVAVLFGRLTDLSASLSDEEFTRLEATFLAAALPAAGPDWKHYQEGTVRAVSSPDPLNSLKILEAYQRAGDSPMKQALAELLIARVGVAPKSWEPSDVVAAVRKGLGASGSAAATGEQDRWQTLRLQADAALAWPVLPQDDQAALLARAVELAHLTTLAIALAQGDAGHAVFDAGLDKPPQLGLGTAATRAEAEPSLPRPGRAVPPLSSRDERVLQRWIGLIAGYDRQQPVQRQTNMRALAQAVDKLADLTPAQAGTVAEYVLAEKTDEENQAILPSLAAMRRWNRLRLAVADGLPQSKLTPEQLQQVAGRLLGTDLTPQAAAPDQLRLALLSSVLSDLDEAVDTPPVAAIGLPTGELDQGAGLLAETYRARGGLLGAAPQSLAAADSPAKAAGLSLDPLIVSLRAIATDDDAAYLARLPHEAQALEYVHADDLHRTAGVNRVLVHLSARRAARLRPAVAASTETIVAELAAAELASTSVLAQLVAQETAALKIWMLHAPQL